MEDIEKKLNPNIKPSQITNSHLNSRNKIISPEGNKIKEEEEDNFIKKGSNSKNIKDHKIKRNNLQIWFYSFLIYL